jgi:LPXTG-site transpeptidase (sortase) family protein
MRKYPLTSIISGLLLLSGIVIVGVAAEQKAEMRVSAGDYVLPALAFHKSESVAAKNQVFQAPRLNDFLGTIAIPALKITVPIYEGTTDAQLKKGVGHFIGSVLPGVRDNSVLAGHRDSVFSKLGKIRIGDLVTIDSESGIYQYKVARIRIVEADDRTIIVPTTTAILTLSTCYPFHFIGNAPKRFIVSAQMLPVEASAQKA